MSFLRKAGLALASLALITFVAAAPAFADITGTIDIKGSQGDAISQIGDSLFSISFDKPLYLSKDSTNYLISYDFVSGNTTSAADLTRLLTPSVASGYKLVSYSYDLQDLSSSITNIKFYAPSLHASTTETNVPSQGLTANSSLLAPVQISLVDDHDNLDYAAQGLVFSNFHYDLTKVNDVPEPGAITALVSMGLGGVAVLMRRRK